MKYLLKLTIVSTLLALFAACSGESPEIKYSGISDEAAVQLLQNAKTASEVGAVASRIENSRHPDFNWPGFWNRVQSLGFFTKYSNAQKKELLNLFALQCDQKTKNAQAQVIIDHPEYYSSITGRASPCKEIVSSSLYSRMFKNLLMVYESKAANSEYAGPLAVEHLFLYYESNGADQTVIANLNSQTEMWWKSFLDNLISLGKARHLADFIAIYEATYGKSSLVNILIVPLLKDGVFFETFLSNIGSTKGLEILSNTPSALPEFKAITSEQWQRVAHKLVGKYSNETSAGQTVLEQAKNSLITYQQLISFLHNIDDKISAKDSLSWFDMATRKIELTLAAAGQDGKSLIAEYEPNTTIIWLRHRLRRDVAYEQLLETLAESPYSTRMEKFTQLRLKIHLNPSDKEARSSISDFCKLMNASGITDRHISLAEFSWEVTSQPGCVHLNGFEVDAKRIITTTSVTSSVSSVVLTHGASVKTITNQFRGSIIDGSTTSEHSPLPSEPSPIEHDSLALPTFIGFRLVNATELLPAGIYYFPIHYIVKNGKAGPKSDAEPKKGFTGGDIVIHANPGENFAPRVISLGGKGQKGVPRRLGGKEMTSKLVWKKFDEIISLADDDHIPRFLMRPAIYTLTHILDHAELLADGVTINLYVSSEAWLNSLETEQIANIESQCKVLELPQQKDCLHKIAELAAIQISTELDNSLDVKKPNYTLPQMVSQEFTLPAGELGPINPDGAAGDSGIIELKGFSL